jgi:hypothetical protein
MQRYTFYLYLDTTLHVSGGTSTHHQERIHLYLQHLVFVTPLLLSAATAADSSNGVTNTRCFDTVVYAPDDGWRYHPKHVEQFPDKINSVTLHLVGYILEFHMKCFRKLSERRLVKPERSSNCNDQRTIPRLLPTIKHCT